MGRQTGEIRRHAGGNPCHVDSESVLCYGTARILDDLEERRQALNDFQRCFRPEAAVVCCVVEIAITEMTGRRESSRARAYWRYLSWPKNAVHSGIGWSAQMTIFG